MDIQITMVNNEKYIIKELPGSFSEFLKDNGRVIFSTFNGDNGKMFSLKTDHIIAIKEL